MDTLTAFLLTGASRDSAGHFEIILHAVTSDRVPLKITIDAFNPLFFVNSSLSPERTRFAAERKRLELTSLSHEPVDCLYFSSYKAFSDCAKTLHADNLICYESDVHPMERFLMERLVRGTFEARGMLSRTGRTLTMHNPVIRGCEAPVSLGVMSVDIETNAATDEIYCIACSGSRDVVYMRGAGTDTGIVRYCPDEKAVLSRFYEHCALEDPDVVIGWNVIDFDLSIIQKRSLVNRLPFALGRDPGARITQSAAGQTVARIPGRVVLDVPLMLRAYFHTFEEYSLNFVATAFLGKHKTITLSGKEKIDEINHQFETDKQSLAAYNLEDARLTQAIFDKAQILPDAIERSKHSGHLLDRTGGSIAAFDYLYLPRLHRAGYVAPDASGVPLSTEPLPGGYVIEPTPGIYENVLVFDFKSLYPSIIMTFKIDPAGLASRSSARVKGPAGPSFAVEPSILPALIDQLMEGRAVAKRDNNPHLSQAIKILMNSFYGVLGAAGCRFFNAEIAATITRTGQYILKQTIAFIEKKGLRVIYGDTDSLFVLLGPGNEHAASSRGAAISAEATAWLSGHLKERFNVQSRLELQYETHFRHFFMPAIRGSTQGSKKHYCGSIESGGEIRLAFKGMESARSDWTELAKELQHELLLRLFSGQPLQDYVLGIVRALKAGELDSKLVYKKRLRKALDEYTTTVPQHVQAARLLPSPRHLVRYYITLNGPQPLENLSSPIDYDHYVECQLKPVADSILEWTGTSFDKIFSGQQDLFG